MVKGVDRIGDLPTTPLDYGNGSVDNPEAGSEMHKFNLSFERQFQTVFQRPRNTRNYL